MKTPLQDAIDYLRCDDRFKLIITDLVERREHAISGLALYKDDTELRKRAAEITVYTEFLDTFGVPVGEAAET
jgi:hypothetical protein